MGYYIRVLGTQNPDFHIDELMDALEADGLSAKFLFDPNESPDKWSMVDIHNQKDEPLAQIQRNAVIEGELGKEELDEFEELIQDFKPMTAANWIGNYFKNVKVIYAVQMLNAAFENTNYEIINSIRTKIWNSTKGILQADNEGFTNEDGDHILWQFSDEVEGPWNCAVLNQNGEWEKFTMELSNMEQRKDFQNGVVPKDAFRRSN
jgi:hypothetical protein